MNDFARLDSVDAMHTFRGWLCQAAEVLQAGLDEADAEISRTVIWIKQEQQTFWKAELRKRTELFNRAKIEFNRKKNSKTPLGGRYSAVDEKVALDRAKRRLEEAQQKLANVQRWTRRLEQELYDYQGAVRGLSGALGGEIPKAVALLDRMTRALDAYTAANTSGQLDPMGALLTDEGVAESLESIGMARQSTLEALSPEDLYRTLCKRLPSQKVRDTAALGDVPIGWQRSPRLEEAEHSKLPTVAMDESARDTDNKVIIAYGAAEADRIFLLRSGTATQGDSGWYIAPVDDESSQDVIAVRADDLTTVRPDIENLLGLPTGYCVVIKGSQIEWLFDDQGKRIELPSQPGNAGGEA